MLKAERKVHMFNYDNLWKLLIDKGMKKKDLVHGAKITPTAVAKMGKRQPVSLVVIGNLLNRNTGSDHPIGEPWSQ